MTAIVTAILELIVARARRISAAWQRFWFTPVDVAPLAAIRIASGLVLLYTYAAVVPDVMHYLGDRAWIDSTAIHQLRSAGEASGTAVPPWHGVSIWFYLTSPVSIGISYALFLTAIVCFVVGFFTRTTNVIVWIGHLSFVHRAFLSWSGMDTVLAMLTFYLMFAPSGAAFSIDRRRSRISQDTSWTVNVVLRLIQIHMCIIYLCAGLSKLQGNRWWDGTAVWMTISLHEYAPFDMTWLGFLGDDLCHLISNAGVLLTLGFEIGFAFLIWNPTTRPMLLTLAVLLHVGIGFFMGMAAFGMAMLVGCLAFADAAAIRRFAVRVAMLASRRVAAKPAKSLARAA